MNSFIWSRRKVLLTGATLPMLTACGATTALKPEEAEAQLSALEAKSGGRIGVYAENLKNGLNISRRADERFAMCSSFKWLLGALIAHKVIADEEDWDRMIAFSEADLMDWSPVVEPALAKGELSIAELCKGTIQTSDNTAANLLLKELGGPEGFTALIRSYGDEVTRLDRWEPGLNQNKPGDPRDTTTPRAMSGLLAQLLFLRRGGRNDVVRVKEWMLGAETGLSRLRAGISDRYLVGDKTGTSSNNQSNDVAIVYVFPTMRGTIGPVVISSYLNVPDPMSPETDEIHAEIGRIAMKALVTPIYGETPWT